MKTTPHKNGYRCEYRGITIIAPTRAAGLVRFERWVTPEHKIKLVERAEALEKEVNDGN